jgi:hypothetical protein
MQAVDRHAADIFNLPVDMVSKKYYVKIILGLVDMALVNAYIHYKLRKKRNARKIRQDMTLWSRWRML